MTVADLVSTWRSRASDLQPFAPGAAAAFARAAEELERIDDGSLPTTVRLETRAAGWRERLWTCPEETRLSIDELADAVGKPKSWCYRHTSQKSGYSTIPHTKLDGEIVFRAGDVRQWLRAAEREDAPKPSATKSAGVVAIGERRRKA